MHDANEVHGSSNILRLLAAAILVIWLGSLGLTCLEHGILLPFAWPEVGAVYVVCTLPLAWLLWQAVGARIAGEMYSMSLTLVLSAAMLGVFRLLFWNLVESDAPPELLASSGVVLRIAAGLTGGMGIVGLLLVANHRWFLPSDTASQLPPHMAWALAALALVLVPSTYAYARAKADAATAHDYLSQSRLAEAADLLRRCLVLDASGDFEGRPFRETLEPLNVEIQRIRQQVRHPLPDDASEQQRIERGTALAILGQSEEALLVLLPAARSPQFGKLGGHHLLGTLYQDRRDWEKSLFHFRLAMQPGEQIKKDSRAQAVQGQAFALRKLGRIEDAEAAYLELLGLIPSADNHFLLAQFYEDIQETSLAAQHAADAKRLDPARYEAASDSLVRRAQANHFGCFQLFGQ